MGKREWQKLLTLVVRGVQQQFQMSEFRVCKCDRTDSCQTKPHDSNLTFVNTRGQIPDCPAELSAIPPRPSEESGRKQGAWMDGRGCLFLSFIPVPPNTGVTVLTLNQYGLALHQPASLSLCPFPLPGPKVFGYLSHKTLLKSWQANLPMKGLKRGWKPLALKKWHCKRIFTPVCINKPVKCSPCILGHYSAPAEPDKISFWNVKSMYTNFYFLLTHISYSRLYLSLHYSKLSY